MFNPLSLHASWEPPAPSSEQRSGGELVPSTLGYALRLQPSMDLRPGVRSGVRGSSHPRAGARQVHVHPHISVLLLVLPKGEFVDHLGAVWFTKSNVKGNGNGLHSITDGNKFK